MRLNKFIALATGLSRRAADRAIEEGRVLINGQPAEVGRDVKPEDKVTLDRRSITPAVNSITIMINKPTGYVVSREGQGSQTIYELLPAEYQALKPVGRLDKDSSGLLLLTNDGELANQLTHPRYAKTKIYAISLDQPLQPLHQQMITDNGITLDDGPSRLGLMKIDDLGHDWQVTMNEGRNRQIRRTFQALGYEVTRLHRTNFGQYALDDLPTGDHRIAQTDRR